MEKPRTRVACPYAAMKGATKSFLRAFTSVDRYPVILVSALAVSIGIIFIALDILKFPFVTYDSFGSILCLGGARHTVGVLLSLFLIPFCAAKIRFGFLGATLLGILLFALCTVHVAHMLAARPYWFQEQIHGPVIWAFVQLPVIIYGYKSFRKVGKKAETPNDHGVSR
jgi:hypothetical protein